MASPLPTPLTNAGRKERSVLEGRFLRLFLTPLTMLLTLGVTTGVSSANSITTFTRAFHDLVAGETFFPDVERFKIEITDAQWANQGDVRLLEGSTSCSITDCSDVIRFINVASKATIFFLSDHDGSVDLSDVPALPGGAFIQYSSEASPTTRIVPTQLGNVTALIRSDPSDPDDSIRLTATPVPEPATLLLLGSGFLGLGGLGWRRRRP